MSFIADAGYCAGLAKDLEPGALRPIAILGEPVDQARDLGPSVLLQTDGPAVRARRIIKLKLEGNTR